MSASMRADQPFEHEKGTLVSYWMAWASANGLPLEAACASLVVRSGVRMTSRKIISARAGKSRLGSGPQYYMAQDAALFILQDLADQGLMRCVTHEEEEALRIALGRAFSMPKWRGGDS